ncbi:MAG: PSD1 domain-containing protein [Acidobacteria bacterium]|nr:PSD1 domain-containing protein [Acidobacteriota bacterium]
MKEVPRTLLYSLLAACSLPAQPVDFIKNIEPIFAAKCYACHGPSQQTSGLRLDERAAALAGGYGGKVIIPGKPDESLLVQRVTGANGLRPMPMGSKGLPADQVALIKAWIEQGANYPVRDAAQVKPSQSRHWAFQPIRRPGAPAGAIDFFVRDQLTRQSLSPSPEADKPTLLRRLSLDITGLPPAPAELAAFLDDASPNAYEKQVDRLLASPQYGEKWARHWLDQARYADSDGYEKDWARPWSWRWRNWVIDAINRDMPFDQFTREQIAGDLLPNSTVEQRVATGFHRHTLTNREGGIDNNQFRFENVADRSSTVGSVWLGLTVGCAQCHDHKYDPTKQKDFYQLYAFFDNADEEDIDAPLPGETGLWMRKAAEFEKKRAELIAQYKVREKQPAWEVDMLDAFKNPGRRTDWDLAWDCLLKLTEGGDGERIIKKSDAQRTPREQRILETHFIRNYHFAVGQKVYKDLKFDELDKKLRELEGAYPQLTQAYTILEDPAPHQSHLRIRGDFKQLGIPVEPDSPSFLPPLKKQGARATRLDLAAWLTAPENPLTARVTVNRIWQELFGQGIVKTPEDFGVMGARPSHPELLDYLAAQFRDSGWSRKQIIRTIVTSATYKQSSGASKELVEKDPENKWLARQSRTRLNAETIRDAALFAAGLLDLSKIGGPSIKPPQPDGVTSIGYARGTKWEISSGTDQYRRGLYIHFQRTTPYPLLMNFDAPRSTTAACRRLRSNTSLQALNLLNDPVFLEAAEILALRVLREGPAGNKDRIQVAARLVLNRDARPAEIERLSKYLDQQRTLFANEKALPVPIVPGIDRAEHAAWTGLASVLLNLDEFVNRE